jgi:hypothetical protein
MLGGLVVGADMWVNGVQSYGVMRPRASLFDWLFGMITDLIGKEGAAVVLAALMGVIGYGLYRIGELCDR